MRATGCDEVGNLLVLAIPFRAIIKSGRNNGRKRLRTCCPRRSRDGVSKLVPERDREIEVMLPNSEKLLAFCATNDHSAAGRSSAVSTCIRIPGRDCWLQRDGFLNPAGAGSRKRAPGLAHPSATCIIRRMHDIPPDAPARPDPARNSQVARMIPPKKSHGWLTFYEVSSGSAASGADATPGPAKISRI
jgi:hypothetical protein